jgi:hypothetical protein
MNRQLHHGSPQLNKSQNPFSSSREKQINPLSNTREGGHKVSGGRGPLLSVEKFLCGAYGDLLRTVISHCMQIITVKSGILNANRKVEMQSITFCGVLRTQRPLFLQLRGPIVTLHICICT